MSSTSPVETSSHAVSPASGFTSAVGVEGAASAASVSGGNVKANRQTVASTRPRLKARPPIRIVTGSRAARDPANRPPGESEQREWGLLWERSFVVVAIRRSRRNLYRQEHHDRPLEAWHARAVCLVRRRCLR